MCACEAVNPSKPDPTVLSILDEFWDMFLRNRSLCGYIPLDAVGMRHLQPGDYYDVATPYEFIVFKEPITLESRAAHNAVATWNNENFMLRLWAILESNGFTKPLRESAARAGSVKVLKGLRQHFGHGSGRFDLSKPEHRRLNRDIAALFPVVGDAAGIPLSIDTVLEPMLAHCREYVQDVLKHESDGPA
jgi:hypothetical protein